MDVHLPAILQRSQRYLTDCVQDFESDAACISGSLKGENVNFCLTKVPHKIGGEWNRRVVLR